MKAGFFETDITPPLGADRPGDFAKLKIKSICDPLKVRVAVFSDGKIKIALAGIDNIGYGSEFFNRVSAELPDVQLVLNSSHTHYGANLRDPFPGIDSASGFIRRIVLDESVAYDDVYYHSCIRQVVTAVRMAEMRMEDAVFSFGRGRVENMIFNRRIRMKNGHVLTHPGKGNPDSADYAGTVDDEVGTIGVWTPDGGRLIGCVINFSCHACINLEGATSDFPGVAIDTVRRIYGSDAGAVYINGASGDITQIDNLSLKLDTGKKISVKLGRCVGAEAVRQLASADRGEIHTIAMLEGSVRLKRQTISDEEKKQAFAKAEVNDDSAEYKIAKTLVMSAIETDADPVPAFPVGAVQIGPLLIGVTPFEMFAAYALEFKKTSRFPFTWFSQLSNGPYGYIPTQDAFDPEKGGGYEAATAPFRPEAGAILMREVTALSARLTPEEAPAPETVKPVSSSWSYNFKRTSAAGSGISKKTDSGK